MTMLGGREHKWNRIEYLYTNPLHKNQILSFTNKLLFMVIHAEKGERLID